MFDSSRLCIFIIYLGFFIFVVFVLKLLALSAYVSIRDDMLLNVIFMASTYKTLRKK